MLVMSKTKTAFLLGITLLISSCFVGTTTAACLNNQQSCSASYGVSHTFFGSGGSLDTTCSTDYCAKQALGELAAGESGSANYKVQAGNNVERQPSLEFMVNTTSVNLGVLSTSSTATATASFSVESYLSSGYSVETISPPPQYGAYTMPAPSTPTASTPSSEQFGMNLVANTTTCGAPANFGANPVEVPSTSYSFGQATANYDTCGKFMYKNGDSVAESTQSSGQTNYTISYIANISNLTPGGQFVMNQQLVAVPTF